MKKDELIALGVAEDIADKVLVINGKDIEKQKKRADDAELERDNYKNQAETAQQSLTDTLAKFEGLESAEAVNQQIADLKAKNEVDKAKWEKDIAQRDQSKWLDEKLNEYGVSSPLARKAIIADCMSENGPLKWSNNQFYGFGDYMAEQKKADNALYQTAEEKAAEEAAKAKADNAPAFANATNTSGGKENGANSAPTVF